MADRGCRIVLILLSLLILSPAASADEVWPYRSAVLESPPIFLDPRLDPVSMQRPNLSFPALTAEVFRLLEADPRFAPLSDEDIRRVAAGDASTSAAITMSGNILRDRGIEEFSQYNLDSAIDSLNSAVENYRHSRATVTHRRDVGMAYEFLARAYLERSYLDADREAESRNLARQAFAEMIRLIPAERIDPNRYPVDVVQMYQEVYVSLLSDHGGGLRLSESQAADLAQRHGLDVLFYPYFIGDEEGIRLVLQVISLVDRSQSGWFVTPLTSDTHTSLERVNRLMSQVVACVPVRFAPPPPPPPGDEGRFYLQVGWGGGIYGSKPTRSQFLNQGVVLNVSYHVTEYLAAFVRANVMFGSRDPDGNLIEGFTSLRSVIGLSFSYHYGRFRGFVGLGVEGNQVGAFRATNEFWCKVSEGAYTTYAIGMDCLSSEVTTHNGLFLVGPHLMGGFSIDIAGPFAFFAAGNFAFYLSDSINEDVGFPISGESGIQYRF